MTPLATPSLRGAAGVAKEKASPAGQSEAFAHVEEDAFDLSGSERAVRHDFDPHERKWIRTAFLCRIEPNAFAEGAMRTAHHLSDLAASGADALFVAKVSKEAVDPAQYFADVQMQMEARMWAQRYNEHDPPKSVDFIAAFVLERIDLPGKPLCGVEKFIAGNYRKWNNNWDWSDDERNTPQASPAPLSACDR